MSGRYPLLNTYISPLTMQETVDMAEQHIRGRKPVQHVVLNAGKTVMMQDKPDLLQIINTCPIINADGQAVVWAGRLMGIPIPERVAGIDLMHELLAAAEEKQYRVFFLGATQEVIERTVEVLQARYPGLVITGYRNGYFSPSGNEEVVRMIAESKSDILFVGISSPFKETWLHRHLHELNVPFCMGVGGSFDVVSGLVQRAPKWIQRAGMEWLYRLLQEPKRMWKRYLIGNSRFIGLVLRNWILSKRASLKERET